MSFSGQALRSSHLAFALRTACLSELDGPPELEAVGSVVSFARNETLFEEGGEIAACYKVVSGRGPALPRD